MSGLTSSMPKVVWNYSIPGDSTWVEWYPKERNLDKKITLMKSEFKRALSLDYRDRTVKLPNGKWSYKDIYNDDEFTIEVETKEEALFFALHDLYEWIHSLRAQIDYYEDESIPKEERIKNFPGGKV